MGKSWLRTERLAYANRMSHGLGLALVMDCLSLSLSANTEKLKSDPLFNVHLSLEAERASPAHAESWWLAVPANWLPDWETLFPFTASFTCKCQRTQRSTTPEGPFMKRPIHLLSKEWSADGSAPSEIWYRFNTKSFVVTMVTESSLCKISYGSCCCIFIIHVKNEV